MCLRFSDMESKLGEIDRARAIYSYCSQICDPRVSSSLNPVVSLKIKMHLGYSHTLNFQLTATFWQTWKEFEIRHGNEDTIREMLRIKRSVQATYNTQVNFMSSQMMKATTSSTGTGERAYDSVSLIMTSSWGRTGKLMTRGVAGCVKWELKKSQWFLELLLLLHQDVISHNKG